MKTREFKSLSLTALLSLSTGLVDVLKNPAHAETPKEIKYRASWIGNTFDGNERLNQHINKHVQNFVSACEVDSEGNVFTKSHWDEDGLTHGKYYKGDVIANETERDINVSSVVDRNGAKWSIQDNTVVKEGTNIKIGGLVKPTALAIDNKDGHIMVADDGEGKYVVEFYDTQGKLIRTIGTPGGVKATNGKVGPTVFWGITGTGTDADGNIYVCTSRYGTRIVSLKPDGETLDWEVVGLPFIDMPWFDPDSNGKYAYGKQEVYEIDYSKPDGQNWKLVGYSLDEDSYPDDPRAGNEASGGSVVFVGKIKGQKFMFTTDGLNGGSIHIFKFSENSHIAVPAGKVPRDGIGPAFSVDKDGTFWELKGNTILKTEIQGLDGDGNIIFNPTQEVAKIEGWVNLQRIYHDPKTDSVYVTGGKNENIIEFGGDVARYDNVSSGSPTLSWHKRIPYNWYSDDVPIQDRILGIGFLVAEDRVFVGYLNKDTEGGKSNTGAVRMLDAKDGEYLTTLSIPRSGWIDLWQSLSATRLDTGELVVLVEEDAQAKTVMYIVEDKKAQ
ncbi:MAG: hypothetical protein SAK29_38905 [Scytonema sp. PMC 1069.18]|nr:hypothetical protein [Scytonema sp. PMC 1069.18]MEC4886125.1 hypothetical protein [Scytonema sp. PMC 1070.18]